MRSLLFAGILCLCTAFAVAQSHEHQPTDQQSKHEAHGDKDGKNNKKQTGGPQQQSADQMNMPGMQQHPPTGINMPGMEHEGMHEPQTFVQFITAHNTSGTSAEPVSTPAPMLMTMRGNWMLMFHGLAFINELQQSGPRGGDKFFSTNWFMPMAQWHSGSNTLTFRTMLSLDPGTVTQRRYPELFQLGETAFGRPIVDAQHPHDFFMEVAALYDVRVGENALLSLYAAPVGDPAMGPTAYPHRASASENPMAALGHHLQDSTHIADSVLTGGITYKMLRVEASGFHGREPDEGRWNIDTGVIDSWSTRFTVNPARNWSMQYSIAHLTSPEALHPDEDVQRMTASVMYNRPLPRGNWATSLIWGRNRDLGHRQIFNGYLAESTVKFLDRNNVWGRIENVDRTNEIALGEQVEPAGFEEHFLARIQAYTAGYDREFSFLPHLSAAIGGQVTFYSKPSSLTPIYGDHPVGALVFLRLRASSK